VGLCRFNHDHQTRLKRTVEDILAIGKELCRVRELMPQDILFGQWREGKFGMHRNTAANMMRVYERFGEAHNYCAPDLSPTVLYELAKPSTPDTVVEDTLAAAEAGEKVTVASVKDQIAQAKAQLSPEAEEELEKEILAKKAKEKEKAKEERAFF